VVYAPVARPEWRVGGQDMTTKVAKIAKIASDPIGNLGAQFGNLENDVAS